MRRWRKAFWVGGVAALALRGYAAAPTGVSANSTIPPGGNLSDLLKPPVPAPDSGVEDSFGDVLTQPLPENPSPLPALGGIQTDGEPSMAPPPEVRTPAQLQAVLEAYLGHWKGQYLVHGASGIEIANFPIEVVYVMEKDGARPVLIGTTTYAKDGKTVTEITRSWVQDGQIMAQTLHDGLVDNYSARTRGDDVVWFTLDPHKNITDFSLVETIKLTPDGGTLTMKGFDTLPKSNPPVLVLVTAELVKVPDQK
jgi:hypothetical protein